MTRTQVLSQVTLALLVAACGASNPASPQATTPKSAEAPAVSTRSNLHPKLGTFGVDTTGMDTTVKPGKDFHLYASGTWLRTTKIPADKSRWGTFDRLREEADENVHKILEEKVAAKGNAQKARDYYAAYLDAAAIDAKGFAPAKPALDAIAAAKTLDDIVKLMARPDLPLDSPISLGVTLDQKNPDRYVVTCGHEGLGLPEREFYLKTDQQFVDIRTKYEAHIARVLAMVGDKNAAKNAKEIVALETKIAERHWPIAERREREKTYNAMTIADLQREAPQFNWKLSLEAAGLGTPKEIIVRENTAIPKLAELFKATPVATWKSYLTYHLLSETADVLPSALDKEVFDFAGRTLNGQPEQRDRWKRAVTATSSALGDAVGELYVARHFQPKAKVAMDTLVENLRKAYAARIEQLDWMTPATKKVALEKLAAFHPKIGYPSKWKDYGKLDVVAGDAWGNAMRARLWRHEYVVAKLGKPTDRDEWFMTPQTVNATYNPVLNEITFPAAILQPPFFDPEADPAVNYGGIGGAIGHEMGHGFDDQGAKSDAKGILHNWWAAADVESFKKRTDVLADQYSAFEPLPGIKVNGRLTLGENIGDVGGLTVAHKAYQFSLGDQKAPVIDGFTGDQRFFLGWAQVWREFSRDAALRNIVMSDPHSPAQYRVNGVVRNIDAWYAAFGVKEGDPLFLAPEKRVKIW
jgi:putative endopeptidase